MAIRQECGAFFGCTARTPVTANNTRTCLFSVNNGRLQERKPAGFFLDPSRGVACETTCLHASALLGGMVGYESQRVPKITSVFTHSPSLLLCEAIITRGSRGARNASIFQGVTNPHADFSLQHMYLLCNKS